MRLLAASGAASAVAFVPFAILAETYPSMRFFELAAVILPTWFIVFRILLAWVLHPEPSGRVGVQRGRLHVSGAQGNRSIPFNEVAAIDAVKTGDSLVDTVWVRVWTRNGPVEFSEDFNGFLKTMEAIVDRLPGANAHWRRSIFGEMEAERTVIWAKNVRRDG
jgi:hypothetical protein